MATNRHHHQENVVNYIGSIFDFFGKYTLALNALALLFYLLLTARKHSPFYSLKNLSPENLKVTSFSVVMLLVVLLDILHKYLSSILRPMFNNPVYQDVIGLYWYMSFAITDLLMVLLAAYLINKFKLLRDWVSFIILGLYVVLAMTQALNFYFTWVLEWMILYYHYPAIVTTCNTAVSILAMTFVLRVFLVRSGSVLLFLIRR